MNAMFNLNSSYTLNQAQIEDYQKNGHLFLGGLASEDEISFYRDKVSDLVNKFNTETRDLKDRDTYGRAFLQVFNLWRKCEITRNFVLAKRFARVAAELMQVEHVRIYHDQALFKEPGGGHTPWHQDQYYWPLDTEKTVTMWMPLVDITSDMGIMSFVSGTHKLGYLAEEKISDKSEEFFNHFVNSHDYPVTSVAMARAGDATFHSGWTLHNAPGNKSDLPREVMTIIYYADGTRVLTPDNENRKNDLETWLVGLKPGELAESELNPLVY